MIRSSFYLLSLSLLCQASQVLATPPGNLHGFAQQSALYSDDNDFIGNSDDNIATDIRDFGLNYHQRFSDPFSFAGQIVSHEAGEQTSNNIELDYGFIEYSPLQKDNIRASARLGRVIQSYGLFNDVRDVAHLRPTVFVPYSIYYDRLRKSVFAEDGASFKLELIEPASVWTSEIGIAKPRSDKNEIRAFLPSQLLSGSGDGKNAYFFRIANESALDYRVALSGIYLSWDYQGDFVIPTGPSSSIAIPVDGSMAASSFGVSLEKTFGSFNLISEIFRPQVEYLDIVPDINPNTLQINGTQKIRSQQLAGYLHMNYACSITITCFTQYEYFKIISKDEDLTNATTRDIAAGIRIFLPYNLQFKIEVHEVNGSAWLGLDRDDAVQKWHYYASQINWTF